MTLAIDPTLIGPLATAMVLIIGAIATAAVRIIDAINKRADAASEERQGIAAEIKTKLP